MSDLVAIRRAAIREAEAAGRRRALRDVADAVGHLAATVDAAGLRAALDRLQPSRGLEYKIIPTEDMAKLPEQRMILRGVDVGPVSESGECEAVRAVDELLRDAGVR